MKQRELEFLRQLSAAGVGFVYPKEWGGFHITPEDVADVLDNPDVVMARCYGVSLDRYLQWKRYDDQSGRCSATTRGGRQCKQRGQDCFNPREFQPGQTDRCHYHKTNSTQYHPPKLKVVG